jgi:hypothetical protein
MRHSFTDSGVLRFFCERSTIAAIAGAASISAS